jgi:hypothetical protein
MMSRPTHPISTMLPRLVLVALLVAMPFVLGCDDDVTLIEAPPFFTFSPADAWNCRGTLLSPTPDSEPPPVPPELPLSEFRIRQPAGVPPPEGLFISACPNPAPAGSREMVIEFMLEVQTPGVNLAIINDLGAFARELLVDFTAVPGDLYTVTWLLDGVKPGDYRAYFAAGELETYGDLRVE